MLPIIKKKELFNILILTILIIVINVQPLVVNASVIGISSSVEKYRMEYVTQNYIEEETEHFVFRYMPADKDIINMIKSNSEKRYGELVKVFGYQPKEKILIIVFPKMDLMNEALRIPTGQKSMGIYYSGFISIVSPKEWEQARNEKEFIEIFNYSGPILHELTHYFVDIRTNGNYPAWFTEGVALYLEKQLSGFEWGEGVKYNIAPYTVYELAQNFEGLDCDYAYRRSYEIISEYVKANGLQSLLDTMDKLGEGYSIDYLIK